MWFGGGGGGGDGIAPGIYPYHNSYQSLEGDCPWDLPLPQLATVHWIMDRAFPIMLA